MKLELTASVKIYQKEELTMIMITSLLKFLWSLVVWGIPVLAAIFLAWCGHTDAVKFNEPKYGTRGMIFAIVYLTASFCIAFAVKSELLFVAIAFALACTFLFILAVISRK